MKLNTVKAVSIAGLLFISQLTQAAPPTVDTFVVGQPLTAAQMNTIKAFLEYNESNIIGIKSGPSTIVTTSAPTVNHDMTYPYIVGSVWVDTTGGDAYILIDNTSGNAVWKSIFNNTPAVYAIGDTGPAGGIVFYITDLGIHGLEAAPADQSTGAAWGCRNNGVITGADRTAIGTGAQNTSDILAECAEAGIAAFVADEVIINNYGDWYLPSSGELESMCDAIGQGSSSLGNVGNFSQANYWSSTENGNTAVSAKTYLFHPSAAGVVDLDKATPKHVRVIRTF
jgi:hypothetical protein